MSEPQSIGEILTEAAKPVIKQILKTQFVDPDEVYDLMDKMRAIPYIDNVMINAGETLTLEIAVGYDSDLAKRIVKPETFDMTTLNKETHEEIEDGNLCEYPEAWAIFKNIESAVGYTMEPNEMTSEGIILGFGYVKSTAKQGHMHSICISLDPDL